MIPNIFKLQECLLIILIYSLIIHQSNSKRTKANVNAHKVRMAESGVNGTQPIREMSEMDERIMSIITEEAVDGDLISPEVGVSGRYKAYSAPARQQTRSDGRTRDTEHGDKVSVCIQ